MPYLLEKDIGETPYDIITRFKFNNPGVKYSFAGRLDPMARGKMIVLQGEECKKQDSYCAITKVYEFEILFGFSTDTYDILGLLDRYSFHYPLPKLDLDLERYQGSFKQEYPPYSSIIVNKQPLWWWSREGRLSEVTIPKKEVEIFKLEILGSKVLADNFDLLGEIEKKIFKLDTFRHLEFRVPQILDRWKSVLSLANSDFKPHIKKYRATVSSGTYIRSLAHRIGSDLGIGALAWDIHRTEFIGLDI